MTLLDGFLLIGVSCAMTAGYILAAGVVCGAVFAAVVALTPHRGYKRVCKAGVWA